MLTYRFMFWRSGSLCSHKVYQSLVHNPLILCLGKGHVHIHNLHNVGATLRGAFSKISEKNLKVNSIVLTLVYWDASRSDEDEVRQHSFKSHPGTQWNPTFLLNIQSELATEDPLETTTTTTQDGGYPHVSAIINCQLHSIVRCRGRISHYFTHHWDPCNL